MNNGCLLKKLISYSFFQAAAQGVVCDHYVSPSIFSLCVFRNMMQFDGTGITPANNFTQIQWGYLKGWLIFFDRSQTTTEQLL